MQFLRCADGRMVNATAIETMYVYRGQPFVSTIGSDPNNDAFQIDVCETVEKAQSVVDYVAHLLTNRIPFGHIVSISEISPKEESGK